MSKFRNMPTIAGLQIIPADLLGQYKEIISEEALYNVFNQLEDAELCLVRSV